MATTKANEDKKNSISFADKFRHWFAMTIFVLSIAGLTAVSIFMIHTKPDKIENVFGAVVPLIGTWVGTLLAYYFSKENFESASKSIQQIAESASGQEKLKSTPVKDAMRPLGDIIFYPIKKGEEGNCKLADLLAKFKTLERMPLFENNTIVYLIYRATINTFIANKALQSGGGPVADLTLKNFLDEDEDAKKGVYEKSFGFVDENADLAKAKAVMEAIETYNACNDIFVTKSGKKDEAILGWITDNAIARYSKV